MSEIEELLERMDAMTEQIAEMSRYMDYDDGYQAGLKIMNHEFAKRRKHMWSLPYRKGYKRGRKDGLATLEEDLKWEHKG